MCELFGECGVGEMFFNLSGHVQNDIICGIKQSFFFCSFVFKEVMLYILFDKIYRKRHYVEDGDTNLTAFVVCKGWNDRKLDFSVNIRAKISKILFFLFFLFSIIWFFITLKHSIINNNK